MQYTQAVRTTADRSRTWRVLAAVTSYPQWTPSMTDVAGLDGDELAMGHRFRVRQPGLPVMVWRVTGLRDGEEFTWEARSPGVHTLASHRLSTNADGSTEITLRLEQTGPLAGFVRLLIGAKTRRYVALEAAGLKAAAES